MLLVDELTVYGQRCRVVLDARAVEPGSPSNQAVEYGGSKSRSRHGM